MIALPRPDGVIFDCDSTLSAIEGIDELAALKNVRSEVTALTNQAMNGEVPLEAVYGKRLDIIQPRRRDLAMVAQLYLDTITLGAVETVRALKGCGIHVAIVSGGLRDAILPLAERLDVVADDVFAVELQFNADGGYEYVLPSPLTTSTGKRAVAAQWKRKHNLNTVYLVGDGMSDVAAKGADAADAIIGYGGVIVREAVRAAADCFITDKTLTTLLKLWEV